MWSSDFRSGSFASDSPLPKSVAHLVTSAAGQSAAFVIRAEIGLRPGEAIQGIERVVRATDGGFEALAAASEVQAWFFRQVAYRTSGFVTMACVRTGREPLERPLSRMESDRPSTQPTADKLERLRARANQFGFRFVDLDAAEIPISVIEMVQATVARENVCLPVELDDDRLIVAVVDPMHFELTEKLRFILNREVDFAMAPKEQILAALNRYYGSDIPSTETTQAEPTLENRRRNMLQLISRFFLALRSMTGEADPESDEPAACDWALLTFTRIE